MNLLKFSVNKGAGWFYIHPFVDSKKKSELHSPTTIRVLLRGTMMLSAMRTKITPE
jgi:hypothetical protein